MKPKLLLHPNKWSNAVASFLIPLFDEYFERVFIDLNLTYNPKECIVYTHCQDTDWVIPWRDKGFTVVIDNLWESPWPNLLSDTFIIKPDQWFLRANESLWYKALGYDQYQRQPDITKTFLMLMNLQKAHRDAILKQIDLENSIYSYQGRGIPLNHLDSNLESGEIDQRYFNSDWYDSTNFSMVVESTLISEPIGPTEKTWKPIAFRHPFILWGPAGYLNILHQQGFQTFDHIIDESYDSEQNSNRRLGMIIEQVKNMKDLALIDNETTKRTAHNHNLFFDTEWSTRQFKQNLFLPLLDLL
jgi:hypothetical protein